MTVRCWLIMGLALVASPGCRSRGADRPGPPPNILLITVDTLRADKLGCYGSTLGATPNIDALAGQGVLFTRAYAQAPWTLPSFASLLTSLPPPQHGAGGQMQKFTKLAPTVRTVAECFRIAGYLTASIVNVDFLTQPFGLTRGFAEVDFEAPAGKRDTIDGNLDVRNATRTTDAAVAWMRQRTEKPFLLMVHFFDPHLVYAPPAEYRRRFAKPEDRENPDWIFGTQKQIVAYRRGETTFDEATIRRAEKLYDGEVAYTDAQVGRLLAAIDTLGLRERTIVIFTADHGEEFLDHGGFEHGHTLYEELLHVPLVVRWPGKLSSAVVPQVVGLIDVAPTVCALAGVKPDPAFVGCNLFPDGQTPAGQSRPVYVEGNFWGPPLRGCLQEGYKIIVTPQRTMLFNLTADPREQQDLSAVDPQRLQTMQTALEQARRPTPVP